MTVIVAIAGLSACATQSQQVARFKDITDVCYPYREPIIAARETEDQRRIESAAAGAVLTGVLTGAVILMAGGKPRDALLGGLGAAAVGALAGYAKAYYQDRAQRARSREELLTLVNADAGNERRLLTQTSASALALRGCRRDQLAQIRTDFEAKSITKEVARERLAAVKVRIQEDNELISAALDGADKRVTAYVDVAAVTTETESTLVRAEANAAAEAETKRRRAAAAKRERTRKQAQTAPSGGQTAEAKPSAALPGAPEVTAAASEVAVIRAADKAESAGIDSDVLAMSVLLG